MRREMSATIGPVLNEIVLILSGVGVGGLLGVFAKAMLDRRHLKFAKVFDYKQTRYQALVILMWVAMHPSDYEFAQLKKRRPALTNVAELDRELELEYHNAMLYASNKVLANLRDFISDKSLNNWKAATRAMKKDLYL